jgi:hypothetical protein
MTPDELKARTKKFAVEVIRFAKAIPKDHINDEIASQLADAATSTAAHYRAVCRAKSRADFINKLKRQARNSSGRAPLVINHQSTIANQQGITHQRSPINNVR